MLYSIEIFPNGNERVGTPTFYLAKNYESWYSLVQEEIRFFYAKDTRVDVERVIETIGHLVDRDVPATYEIELFGASFVCLCTDKLTPVQFKSYIERHTQDIPLLMEFERMNNHIVFLDWLQHHQFTQQSYVNLMKAFERSDYSFFDKESTASLKVLIEEMVDEMEELLRTEQNRDEKWFQRMEESKKKYTPTTNTLDWVLPAEREMFENHRIVLKKKNLLFQLDTRLPSLEKNQELTNSR
ncbi:hypothetical protein [Psychrobacillus sp. FSL H8-0510]|uniref:hypothetical protein n=1 Tax=Psychrobacillus sp. FSL H8-0510 TaxID=2921394 RepID=UPI0030F9D92F